MFNAIIDYFTLTPAQRARIARKKKREKRNIQRKRYNRRMGRI